jgi:hypothetical protein
MGKYDTTCHLRKSHQVRASLAHSEAQLFRSQTLLT